MFTVPFVIAYLHCAAVTVALADPVPGPLRCADVQAPAQALVPCQPLSPPAPRTPGLRCEAFASRPLWLCVQRAATPAPTRDRRADDDVHSINDFRRLDSFTRWP